VKIGKITRNKNAYWVSVLLIFKEGHLKVKQLVPIRQSLIGTVFLFLDVATNHPQFWLADLSH
jgi:hypothetical protein